MNTSRREPVELAWFAALCDDDYQFLGVPDPALASSWLHCSDIVMRAEANGFDNVLLPSGALARSSSPSSRAKSPRCRT
ncbi:MAG: hypothetical protein EBT21_05365 [Actinobacteria bacterium]|nr:hypothetical protein [Actinomycetota bacterium]